MAVVPPESIQTDQDTGSEADQGTLRFTSANGQYSVDTSLLTRLERARSRCQAEVADILFGSEHEEAQA